MAENKGKGCQRRLKTKFSKNLDIFIKIFQNIITKLAKFDKIYYIC